jgi:hypothetical protein
MKLPGHDRTPAGRGPCARTGGAVGAGNDHLSWTAYWDKRRGLWRVSQDDPDSDLYATSRDADAVIEYMATHS